MTMCYHPPKDVCRRKGFPVGAAVRTTKPRRDRFGWFVTVFYKGTRTPNVSFGRGWKLASPRCLDRAGGE